MTDRLAIQPAGPRFWDEKERVSFWGNGYFMSKAFWTLIGMA